MIVTVETFLLEGRDKLTTRRDLVCVCYLIVKPVGDLEQVYVNAVVEVPNKGVLSYSIGNGFHELL